MKPVEILRKARKMIESPDNWCKGSFRAGDKRCAYGALDAAGLSAEMRDEEGAGDLLRACLPYGRQSITLWNDDYRTTHHEVIATFDKAIALAQKQEATR